jgi:non-specific serine/threonine protein kinase
MAEPPDEAWLRALLEPLLGAIEKLHSEGVYHRDIAPDNIQIEPDGHPVLLDFGAARRVISDKSQALTAILKPAYAPIEQYAEAGSVRQGPWTDIYSLGATLHFLLLGRPPAPATARAVHDDSSALTARNLPGCSEAFLRIIDWMLAPRPADRPQSMAALREVLVGRAQPPWPRRAEPPPVVDWDETVVLARSPLAGRFDTDEQETLVRAMPAPVIPPPARPAAGRSSKLMPIGLGVAALLVTVAAVALWPRPATVPPVVAASEPAQTPAAVPSAPAAVVPVAAPSPAPEGAVTKEAAPAAAPTQAADALVRPSPAAARPAPPRPVPAKPPAAPRRVAPVAVAPVLAGAARETARPYAEAPPPVSTAAVQAQDPVRAASAGPEAICGGRNPLRYFVCMERECLRSEFSTHLDCLRWRKDARRE